MSEMVTMTELDGWFDKHGAADLELENDNPLTPRPSMVGKALRHLAIALSGTDGFEASARFGVTETPRGHERDEHDPRGVVVKVKDRDALLGELDAITRVSDNTPLVEGEVTRRENRYEEYVEVQLRLPEYADADITR